MLNSVCMYNITFSLSVVKANDVFWGVRSTRIVIMVVYSIHLIYIYIYILGVGID